MESTRDIFVLILSPNMRCSLERKARKLTHQCHPGHQNSTDGGPPFGNNMCTSSANAQVGNQRGERKVYIEWRILQSQELMCAYCHIQQLIPNTRASTNTNINLRWGYCHNEYIDQQLNRSRKTEKMVLFVPLTQWLTPQSILPHRNTLGVLLSKKNADPRGRGVGRRISRLLLETSHAADAPSQQ